MKTQCRKCLFFNPVLYFETGNAGEMPGVVGNKCIVIGQGSSGNEQVHIFQAFSFPFQLSTKLRIGLLGSCNGNNSKERSQQFYNQKILFVAHFIGAHIQFCQADFRQNTIVQTHLIHTLLHVITVSFQKH